MNKRRKYKVFKYIDEHNAQVLWVVKKRVFFFFWTYVGKPSGLFHIRYKLYDNKEDAQEHADMLEKLK